MTDQERTQVLKMIQDGKISAEEGLRLMQALDESPAEEAPKEQTQAAAETTSEPASEAEAWKVERSNMEVDPRIDSIKKTVQRLWQIPLWLGILMTVGSAVGMFFIMQGVGLNFWFYFLLLPLLIGVLLIVFAVGSLKARWIFVDVRQKPGEHPERVFLGFPLPLRFFAWFVRTFGNKIPGLQSGLRGANIEELIQIFDTGMADGAIVVHADEGEEGEKVRVFLG